MSYLSPLSPPVGARSWDYPDSILSVQSGTNVERYTADDFFSASIPAALGTTLLATPRTLSSRFVGLHMQLANASRGVNVATARTHDMAPRWEQLNPADGVFVDAGMAAWLASQKALGAEVICTIFGTPTWASARPTEVGDPYGVLGAIAEPADMAKLSAFVTWLVQTYGNSIDFLEVWNEPKYSTGNASFFSGTPAKLAEIARTVNIAAKAVKPSIQIMGVGCTGLVDINGGKGNGTTYTEQFLAALDGVGGTGKDWIDILSVHTYIHDGLNTISRVLDHKTQLDQIAAAAGISAMPRWSTEFSYITPPFSDYIGPVKDKVQALVRYALYHVAAGFDRCVVYAYGTAMGWGLDAAGDAEWNRWMTIINGATVSRINKVGGRLACVIGGVNYLV